MHRVEQKKSKTIKGKTPTVGSTMALFNITNARNAGAHKDKSKEAARKACRGKVKDED